MSGPQVYFSLPPKELFTFPPENLPASLPPPIRERTFRAPFGISPWLFNLAMRPEVPFLFAITYILTVFALNAVNRFDEGWEFRGRKIRAQYYDERKFHSGIYDY